MIEEIVVIHLRDKLHMSVTMEQLDPAPDSFVLIQKVGSGRRDHLHTTTLAVQSYAPSLYQAAQLNERVIEAMDSLIELPEVYRVTKDSDYDFTDTSTKQYRYQAVYDVSHY